MAGRATGGARTRQRRPLCTSESARAQAQEVEPGDQRQRKHDRADAGCRGDRPEGDRAEDSERERGANSAGDESLRRRIDAEAEPELRSSHTVSGFNNEHCLARLVSVGLHRVQRNRDPVVARADLETGPADDPDDRVVDRDEEAVFARDFHWLVMEELKAVRGAGD